METIGSAGPTRDALVAALNAKLHREQNLGLAIAAGAGASLAGALIWMGITVATEMHIGFVALAVGVAVGYAVRYAGRGVDKAFGVVGAIFTLLSCLCGEVMAEIQQVAKAAHLGFFETIGQIDFGKLIPAVIDGASPITYLIYAVGIYEGYKFSFRRLTPEEIQAAGLGAQPPLPTPAAP